jgi:hypothetical protein
MALIGSCRWQGRAAAHTEASDVEENSYVEEEGMNSWEIFLLGMMTAWMPSLIFLALMLRRAPSLEE